MIWYRFNVIVSSLIFKVYTSTLLNAQYPIFFTLSLAKQKQKQKKTLFPIFNRQLLIVSHLSNITTMEL